LVGLLANGEGWHNNHHADPGSARHGHAWYEFDLAWLSIRLLMALGLAKDVLLPSPTLTKTRNVKS
jgi:fatty-acid desaturase